MVFAEKSVYYLNICPYYSMAIWRLWAKKLINSLPFWLYLASLELKNMIPLFLCNSACNFQRKSQNMKNNGKYFILFFAFFSKTVGLTSVFNAKMNSACGNTIIIAFFMEFGEKAFFPQIFALTISWRSGGYGPKN